MFSDKNSGKTTQIGSIDPNCDVVSVLEGKLKDIII